MTNQNNVGWIATPSFHLDKDFLAKPQHPVLNPLAETIYYRHYQRPGEWWPQTVQRIVEGSFSILKNHCTVYKRAWSDDRAQRTAQRMYDAMYSMKFLPPGRGLRYMGTPALVRDGGARLNNPLGLDTTVLTRNGWCTLGDLRTNDIVEVLSSQKLYGRDHTSNASQHTWVNGTVSDIETQPCKRITYSDKFGHITSVIASMNHRWFRTKNSKTRWERVTTEELEIGNYLPMCKPWFGGTVGETGAQHGFFFGDGTRSNGELHQFEDSITVLENLFNGVEYINDKHAVKRHCPQAWSKIPTKEYRGDRSYCHGFLAGYLAADGHVTQDGDVSISSARPEELYDVAGLCNELGIRTKVRESNTKSNYVTDRNPLFLLDIHRGDLTEAHFLKNTHRERWLNTVGETKRDWLQIINIEDAGPQEVRCLTVPSTESFTINGFCLTSNCAGVSTRNIGATKARPFAFAMDMLMCGVGVGFDVLGAEQLSIVAPAPGSSQVFVVEDTRQGWVDALVELINAYTGHGHDPIFEYSKIRPKGSPLVTSGGVSSGYAPLMIMLESVRRILTNRVGEPLRSIDILDIMNLIGKCVVSGNIRRSAMLALGDPDDESFVRAKDPTMYPDRNDFKTGWSGMSNNTVNAKIGHSYPTAYQSLTLGGEPGFLWLDTAKRYGRMKDGVNERDYRVCITNPCGEQSLESYELCCLVETFPNKHTSLDDYIATAKLAYLYAKSVTLVQTHWEETNVIMQRNRRIGCSQSGIAGALGRLGYAELFRWCDTTYQALKGLDAQYSAWLDIDPSVKMTSVKPSGTVSLLAGESPGIHFPHSRYYKRRTQLSANDPIVEKLVQAGYHVEPYGNDAANTVVAEFPIYNSAERYKSDVTLYEQLALAQAYQYWWADNQVSITVSFKEHEAKLIGHAIETYAQGLKAVSFLPLNTTHYPQMPYEEIEQSVYASALERVKPINFGGAESQIREGEYCDSDKCEVPL